MCAELAGSSGADAHAGHFEAVLTSADLGVAKPDPAAFTAAFTAACRKPDVNLRHVLSVLSLGAWLEGDVIAAARAASQGQLSAAAAWRAAASARSRASIWPLTEHG